MKRPPYTLNKQVRTNFFWSQFIMATQRRALVVVLGDLARSPRMQYHCTSLASNKYQVTVIAGGSEDKACEDLESNKNIHQKLIGQVPEFRRYIPSTLAYIVKPIWQAFLLIYQLFLVSWPPPHVILIQNPPTIPTLPILYIYSKLFRTKLIIDWHNYGFSILSLNIRPDHPFVRASKWMEIFFGRLADAGFCVSKAMRRDLIENFKINYPLHVLYDRPPKQFKPITSSAKQKFLLTLPWAQECKLDKPAIIISSTSWTEDEDFDILFDALKQYDTSLRDRGDEVLPDILCVITGKGPLKAKYEVVVNRLNLRHVKVVLPWLTASDYPLMVASSDIGICLHSSSSGVDLPMKVVDMLGCCIPVLAYKYRTIGELVIENVYGQTFEDSHGLHNKLVNMLKDFRTSEKSKNSPILHYKRNIEQEFFQSRWEDNWNRVARPVFGKLVD